MKNRIRGAPSLCHAPRPAATKLSAKEHDPLTGVVNGLPAMSHTGLEPMTPSVCLHNPHHLMQSLGHPRRPKPGFAIAENIS
jgi:hypothetical protein